LGYTITVTNNRDLETKMNRFKQMCSIIRTLNNKGRKERKIKLNKAVAVHTLTLSSEIWNITKENRKQKFKLQR
jgi:hypothetical protein